MIDADEGRPSVVDLFERAYVATAYRVEVPGQGFTLRIGEASAAADALLDHHGAASWVFVTAANPGSRRLADGENALRHTALIAHVRSLGLASFAGIGQGDDAHWPAEPSLLVLGPDRDAAAELGRRFGQNAVVWGERGARAELLWCN